MTQRSLRPLTSLEARIVAVLVEKEKTVPDSYPLSLNALASGCNQKTSREPTMQASQQDILAALDTLRSLSLVIESSGGRVMRYAQNLKRVIEVPTESVALLATLMLRGAQTAAELRANCERLCRFSDVSALEGFLDELSRRAAGPLVLELARQPGARESRWTHLLCGAPSQDVQAVPAMELDAPDVMAEVDALFDRYETALVNNDVATLDALFWDSPRVLRYGASENLYGIDAIRAFRLGRSPSNLARTVTRRIVSTFGRDHATTHIEFVRDGTDRIGRQSQFWVRWPEGWRIVAAHVSLML